MLNLTKSIVLVATLSAASLVGYQYAFSSTSTKLSASEQALCHSAQSTETAENSAAINCDINATQQTWSAWLTGKSRSAQFHYLDFLELLIGQSNNNKSHRFY